MFSSSVRVPASGVPRSFFSTVLWIWWPRSFEMAETMAVPAAKAGDKFSWASTGVSGKFDLDFESTKSLDVSFVACLWTIVERKKHAAFVPCISDFWEKFLTRVLSVLRHLRFLFCIALCHRARCFGSLGALSTPFFFFLFWPDLGCASEECKRKPLLFAVLCISVAVVAGKNADDKTLVWFGRVAPSI